MPRSLEVKTRIRNLSSTLKLAESLPYRSKSELHQIDSYFPVKFGRLKLRELGDSAELIFYDRAEQAGLPRISEYRRTAVSDVPGMKDVLSAAFGSPKVVKKARYVYLVDSTRIHLDEVEGLGTFMELETKCEADFELAESTNQSLLKHFQIEGADIITPSYVDLLHDK